MSNDARGNDHAVLTQVQMLITAVWGRNGEHSTCLQKEFAYQMRFGNPVLFLTLTPNTDNSLVLSQYAGVTSEDSRFDILEARMNTKAELRSASLGMTVPQHVYLCANIDAFIKHELGMDPISNTQISFKGVLDELQAYFGIVETQGRGTLHIHFLIWL
ncbi:hypothetical protein PHMEG_00016776 [Phytophthora megakarya]|uniref:Helitron helicase-like domain-containing protein n=1 Tax=Phytophthora megakarya TaxID=4795 RepID=A0A225W0J3_9STRA|nr:hypothetical protein PHMEG_00016776 [Phytophthora megakarya]